MAAALGPKALSSRLGSLLGLFLYRLCWSFLADLTKNLIKYVRMRMTFKAIYNNKTKNSKTKATKTYFPLI
jgi:hypothetical protein